MLAPSLLGSLISAEFLTLHSRHTEGRDAFCGPISLASKSGSFTCEALFSVIILNNCDVVLGCDWITCL